MGFIDEIKVRARQNMKTIVLPETEDRRVLEAAAITLAEGNANIILVGTDEEIDKNAEGLDISKASRINPHTTDKLQSYIDKLVELRQAKGMTPEKAKEALTTDYTTFAVMMVKMGDADGVVSGACHSTANTLRPCLQILKTAPNTKLVSAFFVIVVPNCEYGENGTFIFGDSGLVQNPNAEELAAIAGSSAKSFELLVGKEAKVAMLSHSTMGSAKHADVDKVVEATCTVDGYKCKYCTVCGAEDEDTKIKLTAPGHNYVDGSCTVCVRFERNDGNDFAEALLPDVSIMKQKGFSPDEIDQLELYLKLNKKDILQKSKDISGITHMFG